MTNIRPITLAESAQMAAARTVETGEIAQNPHAGTDDAQAWRSAYECELLRVSAEQGEA
jgi:hypothetical protein